MATLTNEQIEQKKQLIAEKVKQMKVIYDELVEAGAIELTDEELDGVAGGGAFTDFFKDLGDEFKRMGKDLAKMFSKEGIFSKEAWESCIFTKKYWE